MIRTIWRRVSGPILLAGLSAPVLANCGGAMSKVPGVDNLPGAGNCPDMAKVDEIESFDFEKEFKLDAQVGGKLKAGAIAAANMKAFSDQLDADLKAACGDLAKDLGAGGEFKNGEEACQAAIKAMGDAKAKIGANAKVVINVTEPKCGADLQMMADCAAKCDANVKPGAADFKCEGGKLQGECAGKCEGSCEASAAAVCTGECSGTCDAAFKGTCSGKCTGKCDGKVMDAKANGNCAGVCDGKCEGTIKGECKGKCDGSCEIKGQAECNGTCTGTCSGEMKAPKCVGKVEPPEMSAECKARCETEVNAKLSCTPPRVTVAIAGATDAQAAAQFRAAVEKNLAPIVKIALGTGKRAVEMAGEVKAVVEGAQASIQSAGDPMVGAKMVACLGGPFKGAIDAVASIQANVNVSVNVQASASASGSASGGAKTLY